MPQLDIVAYVAQYMWALIFLLLLFSLIVIGVLPRIQQQLALRAQAEEGQIGNNNAHSSLASETQISNENIDVAESKSLCDLIEVYKALCKLTFSQANN